MSDIFLGHNFHKFEPHHETYFNRKIAIPNRDLHHRGDRELGIVDVLRGLIGDEGGALPDVLLEAGHRAHVPAGHIPEGDRVLPGEDHHALHPGLAGN